MDSKTMLARYNAATNYLNNQTEESWQKFLYTILSSLGGFTITLREKYDAIPDDDRRSVKVKVVGDTDFLFIQPEGYGEPEAANGTGSPVFLEFYRDSLRLIVTPDILDAGKRTTIDLEGAREDRVKEDEYEDGEVVEFTSLAIGDQFYFPLTRMNPIFRKSADGEYVQENAAGEVVGTYVGKEGKVAKVKKK
jgi:hypothetical protein